MFKKISLFSQVSLLLSTVAFANNPPSKTLALYNNSKETIYPVIEAPILGVDPWMQALFKITDVTHNPFQTTQIYRAYLNTTEGGIPPGGKLTITVPFYSQLTQNPSGGSASDQYVDWWNGMRVYFYDNQAAFSKLYQSDATHPVTLYSNGLSTDSVTLPVYATTAGAPLNDPYQLTEYTFANVITSASIPYPIDTSYVDYDLSYVDQVYLPMAIEPAGNDQVGYTGTVMDLDVFRSILSHFIDTYHWPMYTQIPAYPNPRVPGAYNVLIGNQSLTQPDAANTTQAFIDNWTTCINDTSNPRHGDCQHVNALFQANYQNYQQQCADSRPLSTLQLLQNIYGWVSFSCAHANNALVNTPNLAEGESYNIAEHSYQSLQYSAAFNQYVQLIHSALNMNAYAYSIDDAVGNMNEPGTGIVIAIGGSQGLPNSNPYNKKQIARVNPGSPPPMSSNPYFSAYGICSTTASNPLARNTSFSVQSVSYPCEITLKDSTGNLYHFTLTAPPPYVSGHQPAYVKCDTSDLWCQGIALDYHTQQDVNLPPPQATHHRLR